MPLSVARKITRRALVSFAIAGAALFGGVFTLTLVARPTIERAAQAYLRAELERSVRERFGSRADSIVDAAGRTGAIGKALADRAEALRRRADSQWPEAIALILNSLCDVDCEDHKLSIDGDAVRAELNREIAALEDRYGMLREFVVGEYRARLHELIDELRFFSGVNAVMFALMCALLWFHRADMRPALLPTALLLVSTSLAILFYVTSQDWFWTILLGDYMGAWYLASLGTTLAVTCDVVLLRGRVTSQILTAIPSILVPPC